MVMMLRDSYGVITRRSARYEVIRKKSTAPLLPLIPETRNLRNSGINGNSGGGGGDAATGVGVADSFDVLENNGFILIVSQKLKEIYGYILIVSQKLNLSTKLSR